MVSALLVIFINCFEIPKVRRNSLGERTGKVHEDGFVEGEAVNTET